METGICEVDGAVGSLNKLLKEFCKIRKELRSVLVSFINVVITLRISFLKFLRKSLPFRVFTEFSKAMTSKVLTIISTLMTSLMNDTKICAIKILTVKTHCAINKILTIIPTSRKLFSNFSPLMIEPPQLCEFCGTRRRETM